MVSGGLNVLFECECEYWDCDWDGMGWDGMGWDGIGIRWDWHTFRCGHNRTASFHSRHQQGLLLLVLSKSCSRFLVVGIAHVGGWFGG